MKSSVIITAATILQNTQVVFATPIDWRDVCPREGVLLPCDENSYWNELACQCFKTNQDNSECEAGYRKDPRASEGVCELSNDLYKDLYPLWANPNDIIAAELEGISNYWEMLENSTKRCPYDFETSTPSCPGDQYWNELACQCFTVTFCLMMCGEGQEFHPLKQCECASKESIREEFYPAWASDIQIDFANEAGLQRFYPEVPAVPDTTGEPDGEFEWIGCDIVPWCEDDEYLDELTCQCAPLEFIDGMESGDGDGDSATAIIKAFEDMFGSADGATGLIQETTVATVIALLLITFE